MYNEKGVKHLRKIEQFLLKEPRRFNMTEGVGLTGRGNILEEPPCGTTCCIAGASYLITNKVKPTQMLNFIEEESSISHTKGYIGWDKIRRTAAISIGLESEECHRLFHVRSWPCNFIDMYNKATTAIERACVGVLRIEHFIKTKFAE